MQDGIGTGVVQLDAGDVFVAAVVAEVVGMEVRVGATVLADVINVVVAGAEEVMVGRIVIAVVVRLGRIVGKDDMIVGRVGRVGVMLKGSVIDVSESDGMRLERRVGLIVIAVLVRFGRIVGNDVVIVGRVGRVGETVKDTVAAIVDNFIDEEPIEDTLDTVDAGTEDEPLRRVLAVDESRDERVVVGMVTAEAEVDNRVLELPVDSFIDTLEEPLLTVMLGETVVLRVMLDEALVEIVVAWPMEEVTFRTVEVTFEAAEVAVVAVEITFDVIGVVEAIVVVVLGIALLVLWEADFEVEMICAVEVRDTLTVASRNC